MKSISKRMAVLAGALAMVVVLGLTLAACGKGYAELTAEQYQANLTGAGFNPVLFSSRASINTRFATDAIVNVDDVEWYMTGTKIDDEAAVHHITLIKFNDEATAQDVEKAYREQYNQELDRMNQILDLYTSEDMKNSWRKSIEDFKNASHILRVGTVLFYGHQAGIDAAYTTAAN